MTNHFNGLTEAQAERLAYLMEEMAESQQVIGKILRHGYESYDPTKVGEPGPTNRDLLALELGDVVFAMAMVTAAGDVSEEDIRLRVHVKTEGMFKYLHHQEKADDYLRP